MGRLARSRKVFLETFREIPGEEWRRLRSPEGEDYSVTPEWAVFHLVEHEAGHAFQISSLKARARRAAAQLEVIPTISHARQRSSPRRRG